jgi:hypothetical protein
VGQVLVEHLCLDSILNEEIKAVHQALIHPIPDPLQFRVESKG